MLSINASTASFYAHYEAGKANSQKPTHNPSEYEDGNDVLVGGPQSGNDVLIGGLKPRDLQTIHAMYERFYKELEAEQFDNDTPMHNASDSTAGDDAEVFDPATQTWQPTQSAGNGQYTSLGDPYREAIDFEIKADNMGGWQRA